MSADYKEVLTVLCTEVTPLNANETQEAFTLNDEKEAKLAYDVLVAYGFDAKLYRDESSSRLYISRADIKSPNLQQKIAAAVQHAASLKNILTTIKLQLADSEKHREFNINFVNTSSQGKQISIVFPPSANEMVISSPVMPASAGPVAAQQNPPAQQARKNVPDYLKKQAAAKKTGIMSDAPGLAKKYPFGIRASGITETGDVTASKRLTTYLYSNFTASLYAFVFMITLTSLVLTMFITSKGYFCLDFAQVKNYNPPWYCTFLSPPEDPNKRKTAHDNIPLPPPP